MLSSNSSVRTTPALTPAQRENLPLEHLSVLPPIKISYLFSDILPEKFHESYVYRGEVGKGANGVVYKGFHLPSKTHRAIKVVKAPENCKVGYSPKEIAILKSLDHPSVVRIHEVCKEGEEFYIITEFCEGGTLFDRILREGHFSEEKCKPLIREVLSGLAYCHSKGIVHRDIKPENLLFESQKPNSILKIIDFDISANFFVETLNTVCGSAYYVAPEILRGHYTEKVDIWSLGVIFFIMVVGRPPFDGETQVEILTKIRDLHMIDFQPAEGKISPLGLELMAQMLDPRPTMRASAKDLLKSYWFREEENSQRTEPAVLNATLKSLRNFRSHNYLQNMIYFYTTSCILHKEEQSKLTLIFKELDRDNDGRINKSELVDAFVRTGRSFERGQALVESILDQLQLDQNGIGYREFLLLCARKQDLMNDESLRRAFNEWDIAKSGVISLQVIRNAMSNGLFSNIESYEYLFVRDTQPDLINFEQFKEMMMRFVADETLTQSLSYN